MPANFAALEERTALAVHRHLFNASVTGIDRFGAGVAFDAAFDDAADVVTGLEVSRPQLLALSSQVVSITHQNLLLVTRKGAGGGGDYVVVEHQPDGTGMTRLILERMP